MMGVGMLLGVFVEVEQGVTLPTGARVAQDAR